MSFITTSPQRVIRFYDAVKDKTFSSGSLSWSYLSGITLPMTSYLTRLHTGVRQTREETECLENQKQNQREEDYW